MRLKLVKHFPYGEIRSDYEYVTIETESDVIIQKYGDYYHDKGAEKAKGFLDGIYHFNKTLEVKEVEIDDADHHIPDTRKTFEKFETEWKPYKSSNYF